MLKNDIGTILINAGIVSKEAFAQYSAAAAQEGQSVIAYMLAHNHMTQEALAKAYADHFKLPFVEKVSDKMTDINILGRIPLKFLRENSVMPVLVDEKLTILTANPMHFQPLDELNLLLGGNIPTAISTSKIIIDAINKYYPLEGTKQMIEDLAEEKTDLEAVEFGDIDERDIVGQQAEAPVIKLINHILYQAVKQNASDIHIEPYEKELSVRYRIDGKLYVVMSPPKRIQDALISRIKIMANLNIAEKRIPQDGRIDLRIASKPVDIRVSILPVQFGERVVMRILDKTRSFSRLQDMNFSERDYAVIMGAIKRPNGIIYVTGPTGSGKTSTLYAVLAEINKA